MADASRGFLYQICDTTGFVCMFFGGEEFLRSFANLPIPTVPHRLSLSAIGIGLLFYLAGHAGPRIWSKISGHARRKALGDALAENADLKARLESLSKNSAPPTPNAQSPRAKTPKQIPHIFGEFFRVKIVRSGLITENRDDKQEWMMCGFSIQVSLSTSDSVRIEEIRLATHGNKPPCRSLRPIVSPQVSALDAQYSGHTFEVQPQMEYLYDGGSFLPASLEMIVVDEFGAEHHIQSRPGEILPSLPNFHPSSEPKARLTSPSSLVFDGCRAWRSPYTFPVPLGTQNLTVVYVRNNQLASAEPIYNVRARIDYLRDNRPAFSIDAAVWWEEHRNYGLRKVTRVDLEPNEAQCFPVLTEPLNANQPYAVPQSALFAESGGYGTRDMTAGRWTARITVTADHKQPLCGEIEFTVYPRENDQKLIVGQDGNLGAIRLPIECQ